MDTKEQTCSLCEGKGRTGGHECPSCGGKGYIDVIDCEKQIDPIWDKLKLSDEPEF
ncbi:hypothetical protein [Aneurinibacillus migulanus]|uniref:Tryptophan RNA-binding attenuator protein inhibitory protein n=1 Tax=Aneurinibacillus migulanus TaxID=47500 RepID=A0A1G8WHL9_ANEMI|nr:hypothetical protein [Aneurinibacillus migulanus]MED0894924.1 hypothetical protein [Aneurinibacillus migulanus]MED1614433.1 hypothetical protein [Aneurinibacillus migulanus]GED14847.1 hypothetical protein AMI01nite_28380 [Aneurinibacillus migulanus]SDJ77844.1 hypothetical protein SAMN04487909_12855 [Aneurinibacillus migulanus]